MPNVEVLSGSLIIDLSELESGDPAMGVAFGNFISVRLVGGETIPAKGVHLRDFSAQLDPDDIAYPVYSELFPHHVAAYEAQ